MNNTLLRLGNYQREQDSNYQYRPNVKRRIGITQVYPPDGLITGYDKVYIYGYGFQFGVDVLLDNIVAPSVIFVSDSLLVIETPPHAVGIVTVAILDVLGQISPVTRLFEYKLTIVPPVILTLDPNFGPTTGNYFIEATGTGFRPHPTLTFGIRTADAISFIDMEHLLVNVPSNISGLVDVTIENYDGQFFMLLNGFNYI